MLHYSKLKLVKVFRVTKGTHPLATLAIDLLIVLGLPSILR